MTISVDDIDDPAIRQELLFLHHAEQILRCMDNVGITSIAHLDYTTSLLARGALRSKVADWMKRVLRRNHTLFRSEFATGRLLQLMATITTWSIEDINITYDLVIVDLEASVWPVTNGVERTVLA